MHGYTLEQTWFTRAGSSTYSDARTPQNDTFPEQQVPSHGPVLQLSGIPHLDSVLKPQSRALAREIVNDILGGGVAIFEASDETT